MTLFAVASAAVRIMRAPACLDLLEPLDQAVLVPDLAAYERFLKTKLTRLEGIASIESSFALEQVKYTNVLPVE